MEINVQHERLKLTHNIQMMCQELVAKCIFQEGISTIHKLEVDKNLNKYSDIAIDKILESIENLKIELFQAMANINTAVTLINLSDKEFIKIMEDIIKQNMRGIHTSHNKIITP